MIERDIMPAVGRGLDSPEMQSGVANLTHAIATELVSGTDDAMEAARQEDEAQGKESGLRVFGDRIALGDLEPTVGSERHRDALARAAAALESAGEHLVPGGDPVLVSHHVREATLALDELVGVVDVEEVLGRVFAGFCVGK